MGDKYTPNTRCRHRPRSLCYTPSTTEGVANITLRTAALFGLAIWLAFAACRSDSVSDPLTGTEYFAEFQRIDSESTSRVDKEVQPMVGELTKLMAQSPQSGSPDEANEVFGEVKQASTNVFELIFAIADEALESLRQLEPPDDLKAAHLEYIDAGEDMITEAEDAVVALREAESITEIRTVLAPIGMEISQPQRLLRNFLAIIFDELNELSIIAREVYASRGGNVGEYHFEGNASDDSGNGNDGIAQGVDCSVPGLIGAACSFDGDGAQIELPRGMIPEENGTIAVWFKSDANEAMEILFAGPANANGCTSLNGSKPTIEVDLCGGALRGVVEEPGTSLLVEGSTSVRGDGQWHFGVFTWDSSTDNQAVLYLDGQPETIVTLEFIPKPNQEVVWIGRVGNPGSPDRFFNGSIDELGVWNYALSATEVSILYSAGLPTPRNR